MNNIISNLFKNILDFFSNTINITLSLPKIMSKSILTLRLFIHDQFLKFENIIETNIELGKYHLSNGDINDAILRFRIAKFFFGKENPEIHYWLGWCYFIKGNYSKASDFLQKAGKADEVNLNKFLTDPNSYKEVPRAIWDNLREMTLSEGNDKYYAKDLYNKNIELPYEYIEFFLNTIEELVKKPQILDYGCGSGLVGAFLDYKLDKEYVMTGIDHLEFCLNYVKSIRGERGFVYDNAERAFLDNTERAFGNKKYDIILSFDSIGFTKDLSKYIKAFHKNLNRQGIVSILIPASKETRWDIARRSFSFNINEVAEQFRLAKFDIMDIKEWSLGKNKKYASIVVRKK